jgi:DNA-binding NtrC family response regulator
LDIPRGQARILVMDDEPAIRALREEMLTLLGYEPHAVPDGSAAIEEYRAALASRRPYAAVILDLTVPGASGGKEAAVGLRAIDPEVRAIVSSGYSHDPVLGEYERYGFCAAIVKPYDLHRLAQVLRDVLAMEEAST